MKQIRNILTSVLNVLAGGSFIAMVLLTCWQVFTRYVLDNPSTWSEELVGYLFAWMSLFGACLVTGERGHMNIPLLVDKANPSIRKLLSIFAEIIACLFALVILVFGGVQISSLAMGQMTSSLGVPVGLFYIVMPICGVVIALYTVLNIIGIASDTISASGVEKETPEMKKIKRQEDRKSWQWKH